MSAKEQVWHRPDSESPRRETSSESGSSSGSGRDSLSEFAFEMELPGEGWIPDEEGGWIPERSCARDPSAHDVERRRLGADKGERDTRQGAPASQSHRRPQEVVANNVFFWQELQREHAAREWQHSARSATDKACDVELLGSTPPH